MQQKFTELRCKEVINICDGCRMGFVCDAEIEIQSGRITAIYVPGKKRLFGLLGCECDYCIPWACIKRIGEDIILVDVNPEQIRIPRAKKGFFF